MTTKLISKSRRVLNKIFADVAQMPGSWAVATPVPRRVRGALISIRAEHMILVDDTGRAVAAVEPLAYEGPWGYHVFPVAPDGDFHPLEICGESDVLTVPYRIRTGEAAQRIAEKVSRYRKLQGEAQEFALVCDRYRAEAAQVVASAARRLGEPAPHVVADPMRTDIEPWAYWRDAHTCVAIEHNGLLTIEILLSAPDIDTAFARLPTIDKGSTAIHSEVG